MVNVAQEIVVVTLILTSSFNVGDGVENAFLFSPKVFTFSIHMFAPGYFPGTGDLDDLGMGKGRHFNMNIPMTEGASDQSHAKAFDM